VTVAPPSQWLCPIVGLGVPPAMELDLLTVPGLPGSWGPLHIRFVHVDADQNFRLQDLFNNPFLPDHDPSTTVSVYRTTAAIVHDRPDVIGSHPGELQAIGSIEFALALRTPTVAIPLAVHWGENSPFACHYSPAPYEHTRWSTTAMTPEDLPDLKQHVERAFALYPEMGSSMTRFARAWHRYAPLEATVDYVICMEGMTCRGESGELAFKLATRTAILLEQDEKGRVAMFERTKALYNLRSKIVHGTGDEVRRALKPFGTPAEARREAYEITRRIWACLLDSPSLLTREDLLRLSLTGKSPQ
jgi:hypothetical protein